MTEDATGPEKEMESQPPKPRAPIPPDTILIGNKPVMSYATALMMHFHGGKNILTIKARGRAISRAVDKAEIVKNRFVTDAKVKEITIGTESITNEEGKSSNVSSIEIALTTK